MNDNEAKAEATRILESYFETNLDGHEDEIEVFQDPAFPNIYAVRWFPEPYADVENGPHASDVTYPEFFLVDISSDWRDVEEVEFKSWPPTSGCNTRSRGSFA